MNLVQLRCLVALADSDLRLAVAANQLQVSERMLLDQVKQIEGELGLPILLRRGSRVDAITHAGTGIIRRARAVLDGVESIHSVASLMGTNAAGNVVICATHTQARYTLPHALAQFRKLYPNLTVFVRHPFHREQASRMKTVADVDICSCSDRIPTHGVAVPLFRWRRCLVVPRDHPLVKTQAPLTLEHIAEYPLISDYVTKRRDSSLQIAFSREGLKPNISVTTLNAELVKTYVRINAGVGILPEMAVSDQDQDLFWCVLREVPDCTTWAVVPKNRPVSESTLQLIRLLAPHLSAQPIRPLLEGKVTGHWSKIPSWQSNVPSTATVSAIESSRAGLGM